MKCRICFTIMGKSFPKAPITRLREKICPMKSNSVIQCNGKCPKGVPFLKSFDLIFLDLMDIFHSTN